MYILLLQYYLTYKVVEKVNTKSYYMNAGDVAFHAYSDPSLAERTSKNARLIETDIDDIKEFNTMLYNAGFLRGYMDGEPKKLSKSDDISEDQIKDLEDQIQKLTDNSIKDVDKLVEEKSKEILTV